MDPIKFSNASLRYHGIKDTYQAYFEHIHQTGVFLNGQYEYELSEALKNQTGYSYVILCSSGTAALFTIAKFYQRWFNEVLTTPITFRATHNAFKQAGYRLRYTELDESYLGRFEKPNPYLNVPVGLFGKQPQFNNLNTVVEDACQNWIYSSSTVTKAISFDPTKNIASNGNGGAILTNDVELYVFAKGFIRHDTRVNGLNLRMTELECAYVLAQWPFLIQWQRDRVKIARQYKQAFTARSLWQEEPDHDLQKYVIHVPDARELCEQIWQELAIETKVIYPDLLLDRSLLALPIYPELDEGAIQRVCEISKLLD